MTLAHDLDLPEPEIPDRAGRAARLASRPYICTHTGCYLVVAEPGQCEEHEGCRFGGPHPCLTTAAERRGVA